MMNYYYGWHMGGPSLGFGWLLGVVFWILLGILFILLIRKLIWHSSESHYGKEEEERSELETALDILKKRYAKGEISFRDFEKMKKDIS